jgi:hypothetical protein
METRHRIDAARLERRAEHVALRHRSSIAHISSGKLAE